MNSPLPKPLRLQLDTYLFGEQRGQHDTRHRLRRDENRSEALAGGLLLLERVVELLRREQTALDEDLAQALPPDDRTLRHTARYRPVRLVNLNIGANR